MPLSQDWIIVLLHSWCRDLILQFSGFTDYVSCHTEGAGAKDIYSWLKDQAVGIWEEKNKFKKCDLFSMLNQSTEMQY